MGSTKGPKMLLETLDLLVVALVIIASAVLGFYYAWKAKKSKSTTQEFLVANRKLGFVPLVLSMVATYINPNLILGGPMESYSNGVQMITPIINAYLISIIVTFATIPLYYKLNIATLNTYLGRRYNKYLRITTAVFTLSQNSIQMASMVYITALVLSQATGLEYWLSISVLSIVCIMYSSLGGFKAVIWTDVLQVLVIITSVCAVAIKGTLEVGSVADIWEKNRLGHRTTFFYVNSTKESNYTVWSLVMAQFFYHLVGAVTSQTALQRTLATGSLLKARLTFLFTTILMTVISLILIWTGMVIYAKYANCDPLLSRQINSRDQVAALFAMQIFKNMDGLKGLYISGILAATLSTLSSALNSVSTIAMIDFIKPVAPNMPDKTATLVSKIIGCLYGALVIGLTAVVEHFGGIIPLLHAIAGTSMGPAAGIVILGLFLPWATPKGATIGYFTGLILGWWASIGRLMNRMPYYTAPMSTSGCNATVTLASWNASNTTLKAYTTLANKMTQSEVTAEPYIFPLYAMSPVWYSCMTMTTVIIVGLTASFILGSQDPEKLDPRLISPLFYNIIRLFPKQLQERLGYKCIKKIDSYGSHNFTTTSDIFTTNKIEMQTIKSVTEETQKLKALHLESAESYDENI